MTIDTSKLPETFDVIVALVPSHLGQLEARDLSDSVRPQWTKKDPIDLSEQHVPHLSLVHMEVHRSALPHMIAHANWVAHMCKGADLTIAMNKVDLFNDWVFWWPQHMQPPTDSVWWKVRRCALDGGGVGIGFPRFRTQQPVWHMPDNMLRMLPREVPPSVVQHATEHYGYAFAAFPHLKLARLREGVTIPDALIEPRARELHFTRLVIAFRGPNGTIDRRQVNTDGPHEVESLGILHQVRIG